MAGKITEKKYTAFTGVNNVQAEERLKDEELRAAENVDIDDTGRISLRAGFTEVLAATEPHSLWSNNSVCYYAQGVALKQLDTDYSATTIHSDLVSGNPVTFKDVNGDIFYSDGNISRVIRGGTDSAWGYPIPAGQPTLAVSTGSLPVGKYQVALTYADADGRESGAGVAATIELTSQGAIALSAIPTSPEAAVTTVNVYCTPVNGDSFYRVGSVSNGTATTTIFNVDSAIPLRTQFIDHAPAARIITEYNGQMYLASADDRTVLYISEPMATDWFRLHRGFFKFAADITMVAAVDNGVWVSADKTYFLQGTSADDMTLIFKHSSTAVFGTAVEDNASILGEQAPSGSVAVWQNSEGQTCIGSSTGDLKIVNEDKYAAPKSTSGAGIIRKYNGTQHYMAMLKDSSDGDNNVALGDVAVAEIVRNGITIT